MSKNNKQPDLSFQPDDYFWTLGYKDQVRNSIKGESRRKLVAEYLKTGREDELPEELSSSSLAEDQRSAQAGLHPWLMGGEYLPDRDASEVEIARITLASVTQDVTCLYASSQGDIWRYRVVDEYEGETLSGPAELVSDRPLALKEAVDFFLTAWNLFAVLTANFYEDGYPRDRVHAFFWASSPFYPELDAEVRRRVDEWLSELPTEKNDDEDPAV